MIPVDRSGGAKSMVALDAAAEVLDAGHLFLMYPEGTRSRSGNLHKGRTGAARLAMRCGAPIIPVGHTGTLDVQPPDQFKMSPGKNVTVNFGAPLHASDFGNPADPRVHRRMIDAVMFEIAKLSGQTYVNTYAGAKAEAGEDIGTRPTAPDQKITVAPTRPVGRPKAMSPLAGSPLAGSALAGSPLAGSAGSPLIDLSGADTTPTAPTRPTMPPRRLEGSAGD